MLDSLNPWLANYQDYFVWIGIVSTVVFILTLALTPYLLGLIDEDYFVNLEKRKLKINTPIHLVMMTIKSLIGLILLIAGFIMLVTPGQGVVSILLGLFLLEFPGKHKLELKFIHHDPTFKTLNWLRARAHKPPFKRY